MIERVRFVRVRNLTQLRNVMSLLYMNHYQYCSLRDVDAAMMHWGPVNEYPYVCFDLNRRFFYGSTRRPRKAGHYPVKGSLLNFNFRTNC